MIRAFAFDLDETLVDAEAHHEKATAAMLVALGYPPGTARDAFHAATGKRTRDILDAFRESARPSQSLDELLALRHAAFLAALDEEPVTPMPGARELLAECRSRGPVALVSMGHRDDVLATIQSAGLAASFDAIVTGDDVLEPKPAPEAYKIAASRLATPVDEIAAFEDSTRGVASALSAGCWVVAVPNARTTRRDAVSNAHVVLGSLAEALPLDGLLAKLA